MKNDLTSTELIHFQCNDHICNLEKKQTAWLLVIIVTTGAATFLLRNSLNLKQKFIAAREKKNQNKNAMHEMKHEMKERERDIFNYFRIAREIAFYSHFYRSRFMFIITRVITFYNGKATNRNIRSLVWTRNGDHFLFRSCHVIADYKTDWYARDATFRIIFRPYL